MIDLICEYLIKVKKSAYYKWKKNNHPELIGFIYKVFVDEETLYKWISLNKINEGVYICNKKYNGFYIKQLSKLLRVSESTVYLWNKKRPLLFILIDEYFNTAEDIISYLEHGHIKLRVNKKNIFDYEELFFENNTKTIYDAIKHENYLNYFEEEKMIFLRNTFAFYIMYKCSIKKDWSREFILKSICTEKEKVKLETYVDSKVKKIEMSFNIQYETIIKLVDFIFNNQKTFKLFSSSADSIESLTENIVLEFYKNNYLLLSDNQILQLLYLCIFIEYITIKKEINKLLNEESIFSFENLYNYFFRVFYYIDTDYFYNAINQKEKITNKYYDLFLRVQYARKDLFDYLISQN